jgi:HPt (histidine-containing phosphotransfer) domain-containing protein
VERWAKPEWTGIAAPGGEPGPVSAAEDGEPAASESDGAIAAGGVTIVPLPTPDGPVLDRDQLEESCMGNAELRRTLAQTFMADIRPRLTRLDGRIAAGDARAVEFEAHGLKGMCGAIGAVRCAELFGMLEYQGRDHDLAGAPALLSAVDEEVGRVEGVLAPILNAA